jgi:hypothetical protein
LDPKTFKYLTNHEIKDVESQLLAIYPPPRTSRNKNNNSNYNDNPNIGFKKSENKLFNDIDYLAEELGIIFFW